MPTFLGVTLPKRLVRPSNPRAFRITDRDIEILRAIARWRFLTSEQIVRYLIMRDGAASHQHVLRRLNALFAHAYLDRPVQQHVQLSGFLPLVYALGRRGARLLAEIGDSADPNLQWTLKNARATSVFLLHTLETAEVMLRFDAAMRERGLRLLEHDDLRPLLPAETQALDDPFRLRVTTRIEGRPVPLNAIPDRLFSVVLPDDRRLNFALEVDRGTMSVGARKLTKKSSFARKVHSYYAAWLQRRHREQWGFASFRVLTVAPSEKRIRGMLTVQRRITQDRLGALFLYATPERLHAHGPLGPAWLSAEGDAQCLL
jgi:hypothetical protein